MILRRENIAACPAHACAKIDQCFNEYRGLNRHVQRSSDAHARQWFLGRIFFPDRHQPRHFLFGDGNFFSSELGQGDISDFVILFYLRFSDCRAHKSIRFSI